MCISVFFQSLRKWEDYCFSGLGIWGQTSSCFWKHGRFKTYEIALRNICKKRVGLGETDDPSLRTGCFKLSEVYGRNMKTCISAEIHAFELCTPLCLKTEVMWKCLFGGSVCGSDTPSLKNRDFLNFLEVSESARRNEMHISAGIRMWSVYRNWRTTNKIV